MQSRWRLQHALERAMLLFPLLVSQLSAQAAPLPSRAISWWSAEGNADDRFGLGHGVLMNGATLAPGRVGQAFDLDGTNDYVRIQNAGGSYDSERPENAHRLLLEWNAWDATVNPYPARLGLTTRQPVCDLPALPEEDRLDLTHLDAFAIDDRGNQDPDDAVSLVECRLDQGGNFLGGRLWVHAAEAAALAPPEQPGRPGDAGVRRDALPA